LASPSTLSHVVATRPSGRTDTSTSYLGKLGFAPTANPVIGGHSPFGRTRDRTSRSRSGPRTLHHRRLLRGPRFEWNVVPGNLARSLPALDTDGRENTPFAGAFALLWVRKPACLPGRFTTANCSSLQHCLGPHSTPPSLLGRLPRPCVLGSGRASGLGCARTIRQNCYHPPA